MKRRHRVVWMGLGILLLAVGSCQRPTRSKGEEPRSPEALRHLPSFTDRANQISQAELDRLVASVLRLRRLKHQWDQHCHSDPDSRACSQVVEEACSRFDPVLADSIHHLPPLKLQREATLREIERELSRLEETASHYWNILVLALEEQWQREAKGR